MLLWQVIRCTYENFKYSHVVQARVAKRTKQR